MQSLTPGLSLTDNLLLTEELPAPPEAAYRVWFALNVQLGRIVVIKIHPDGRVEPIDDNSAAVNPPVAVAPPGYQTTPAFGWQPLPSVPAASGPVVPPAYNGAGPSTFLLSVPLQPTVVPPGNSSRPTDAPLSPPGRKRGDRWLRHILVGILLLGIATVGYIYRKPLRSYARSIGSVVKARSDSAARPNDDSSVTPVGGQSNGDTDLMKLPPPPIDPNEPAARKGTESTTTMTTDSTNTVADEPPVFPAAAPITAQQAARLLSLMSTIPSEKHPAIFTDARQAFTNLHRASGRQSYIDSLYTVCMGRGAQSIITYQQNGDPVSKRYAVDWYRTAYALKPNPDLQQRIRRLTIGTPERRPKPVRKPAKSDKSLFMPDPEVN